MTVIDQRMAPALELTAPEVTTLEVNESFRRTQVFWEANGDLLPEGVGTVAMLGVAPDHELIETKDPNISKIGVVSLILDARQSGEFTWQLTAAKPQSGAEIYRVHTQADGVAVTHRHVNIQGKVGPNRPLPDNMLDALEGGILNVATHPLAVEQRDDLRLGKERAKEDLAKFEQTEAAKLAGATLAKRREGLRKRIDEAVLTPNKPLPEVISNYQLPLFFILPKIHEAHS